MSEIVLYDIDRKGPRACWSPNVWKARFVLNFKQIEYETKWLEFPEIEPTLKAENIPQPAAGNMYTCPAIVVRSPNSENNALMDSLSIARFLEKLRPEPSLHLDSPMLEEVEAVTGKVVKLFGPIVFPLMKRDVWNAASIEYKERQMVEFTGMSIDKVGEEKGGEAAWDRLQGPLRELAALLKKEDGPFVLGHEVSYADFVVAGILQAGRRIGDGEIYRRVVAVDSAFESLYEATEGWAKRDSH